MKPKIAIVRPGSQRDWHQEPLTAYERMLDRAGLDCSIYACWEPIRAIVTDGLGLAHRYCESHARELGRAENTQWLES